MAGIKRNKRSKQGMGWRQSHAHLSEKEWRLGSCQVSFSLVGSEISTVTAAGGNPCGAASIIVIRLLNATVIL